MPNWKRVIVSGSDAALNSLVVTNAITSSGLQFPATDGDDGQVITTDGSGKLEFSDINLFARVKNISGVTLQKGTPVHASASASPPSGNVSEVIAASASNAPTMPATFILDETIANGAEGKALLSGYINGIDTSAFSEGDVIYVGENGGFTNIKPTGDGNLIQNLGIVVKSDASNGSGYVYGSGRSNDIPNLPVGKIWVGSTNYSVTSSVVHLDETNGRLGIGTNTPNTELEVNGIGYFIGGTAPDFGAGDTPTDTGIIISEGDYIYTRDGNNLRRLIGKGTDDIIDIGATGTSLIDGIDFKSGTTPLYRWYNNTSEIMRLNSTGLGIGTNNPQVPLAIQYTDDHTTGTLTLSNSALDIYNDSGSDVAGKGSTITFSDNYLGTNKTTRAAIKGGTSTAGNTANGFLAFYTDKNSANSMEEVARFDQDGNLGIGTTSPLFKLHVVGTEGGDTTYDGGILIENNNTGSDGEAALAFKVNSMTGGNYWFTGLNQSPNYKIGYAAGFYDSDTFFTITNTGNVGIGTVTPTFPLDVETSNDIVASFVSTDNKASINISDNDTSVFVSAENSKASFGFNSGVNVNNLNVDTAGNVGIGTSSPSSKLEVKGTGGNSSGITLSSTNEVFRQYFSTDAVSSSFFMTYEGTGGADLEIQQDGDIILANNTGGRVGIGTNTPTANLDIEDSNGVTIDINSSAGDGKFRFQDGGVTKWYVGRDNTNQNFAFSSGSSLGNGDVLTLTTAGNVGIGTNTPSAKLDVNGNTNITGSLDVSGSATFNNNVIIDPAGSGTNIASSLVTVKNISTSTSTNVPGQFIDISRNNSTITTTAETTGLVSRVTSTSTVQDFGIYGAQLIGRHSGTGSADFAYGTSNVGESNGTGSVDFVIGTLSKSKITGTGTITTDYARGISINTEVNNPNATVNNAQGIHSTVNLGDGTIGNAYVALLDFDYTGTGNISGDFAYLRIQNDTLPSIGGTGYAIRSLSTLPSTFSGNIIATGSYVRANNGSDYISLDSTALTFKRGVQQSYLRPDTDGGNNLDIGQNVATTGLDLQWGRVRVHTDDSDDFIWNGEVVATQNWVNTQISSSDTLQEVTANGNTTDQGIDLLNSSSLRLQDETGVYTTIKSQQISSQNGLEILGGNWNHNIDFKQSQLGTPTYARLGGGYGTRGSLTLYGYDVSGSTTHTTQLVGSGSSLFDSHVALYNNRELRLGNSTQFKLYNNGSTSYILSDLNNNLQFLSSGSENSAYMRSDGGQWFFQKGLQSLNGTNIQSAGSLIAKAGLEVTGSSNITGTLDVSSVIRVNEIRTVPATQQQLVINAGESYAYATGQTNEYVYVNAERGLEVNSSPDNWSGSAATAWANRTTGVMGTLNNADGKLRVGTSTADNVLLIRGGSTKAEVTSTGVNITGSLDVSGSISATDGTDSVEMYYAGIIYKRNTSYLRPDTNATRSLYIGGPGQSSADWSNVFVYTNGINDFKWNDEIVATQNWVNTQISSSDTLQEVTANGNTTDQGIVVQDSIIKVGSSTGTNAVDSGTIDFLEDTDADFGAVNGYGFRLTYDGSVNTFYLKSGNQTTTGSLLSVGRDSGNFLFSRGLTVNGGVSSFYKNINIGGGSDTEYALQIGYGRTGNGYAYIDLVGDATNIDYGFRIIRNNTGVNASTEFRQVGTGNVDFITGGGNFTFNNDVDITGTLNIVNPISVSEPSQLNLSSVTTNSTLKDTRISFSHYLNAEEPINLIAGRSDSSTSRVLIGGGRAELNAATAVEIYAAANNSTLSGTKIININSTGVNITGSLDVSGALDVSGKITGTDLEINLVGTDTARIYGENDAQFRLRGTNDHWSGIGFKGSTGTEGYLFYNSVGEYFHFTEELRALNGLDVTGTLDVSVSDTSVSNVVASFSGGNDAFYHFNSGNGVGEDVGIRLLRGGINKWGWITSEDTMLRLYNYIAGGDHVNYKADLSTQFFGVINIPDRIAHTGDSNTYLQFHNDDEFRIVTGGVERLEVTNTVSTFNQDLLVNTVGGYFQVDRSDDSVKLADNVTLKIGTGNDLQIYHDGTDSFINNITGALIHKASGTNVAYWRGDASGLQFYDNKQIRLGNSADLQLYHNGNHSYISNQGTGEVIFRDGSNNIFFVSSNGTFHYDNMSAYFGDSGDLQIYHDGSTNFITSNNSRNLQFYNAGALKMQINGSTGDIDFYDDVTVQANLDTTGDIYGPNYQTGTVSGVTGQFGRIILNHAPESNNLAVHPYLMGDLAHFQKKGGVVTVTGLTTPPGSTIIDNWFKSDATFYSTTGSNYTGSTFTVELSNCDAVNSMRYGTHFMVSFGNDGWAPASMKIEWSDDDAATWTTALDSSVKNEVYYTKLFNGADPITNIKLTIGQPTNSLRLMNIAAMSYAGKGSNGYSVSQYGGNVYGGVVIKEGGEGLTLERTGYNTMRFQQSAGSGMQLFDISNNNTVAYFNNNAMGINTTDLAGYNFRVVGNAQIQGSVATGVANANLTIYNDTNGAGAGIKFSDQATTQTQYGTFKFFHGDTSFAGYLHGVHWKLETNQTTPGLNLESGGGYSIGSNINMFNNDGTNDLYIRNINSAGDIFFQATSSLGTSTYYYIDGGNELNRFTKAVFIEDNVQFSIGTGFDLTLIHNTSSNQNYLDINTNDLIFRNSSNTEIFTFSQAGDLTASDIFIDDWGSVSASLATITGNDLDGSGTTSYIPKWSDSDTLTDSIIYDNGTNIGIGTTSPSEKLTVEGNISGSGDINIQGTLTAAVKSFDIPHPTQEGKRLVYGVLEGPEHAVYVRGESKEDTVILPEEWTGLVDETTITVQLTPIGSPDIYYYNGYENNKVKIGGPENKHYFYYIQATRKDVDKLITVQ